MSYYSIIPFDILKTETAFMVDPATLTSSIFLKIGIWSVLSLIATLSLSQNLSVSIRLQLGVALPGGFQLIGPATVYSMGTLSYSG